MGCVAFLVATRHYSLAVGSGETLVALRIKSVAKRSFCINPESELLTCSFSLMDLQDGHGMLGGGGQSSIPTSLRCQRSGRIRQVVPFSRHKCIAIARSTCGTSLYPLAAPPLRVVRVEELIKRNQAVKGAFHDCVLLMNFWKERYWGGAQL